MHKGFNGKTAKVWYAYDVVLSYMNYTENKRPQHSVASMNGSRGTRRIINSSSNEESSTILVYPNSKLFSKRMWTVEIVNRCTLLHRIENISGVDSCMLDLGSGFRYFPYHV